MDLFIDFLTSDLISTNKYKVIDRERLDVLLEEMKFSLTGLAEDQSELEIGKLLSANYIMVGSIGDFGEKYVLNIKIIEVETGAAIGSVSEKYDNFDMILSDTGRLVGQLVGSEISVIEKEGSTHDFQIEMTSLLLFEQTDELIRDNLSVNFPLIQSRVPYLNPDERLVLYGKNEKSAFSGALLNTLPGFGVGSFKNNNKGTGYALMALDIIGILGISYFVYGNMQHSKWQEDNIDYWVSSPDGSAEYIGQTGDFIKDGQVMTDTAFDNAGVVGIVGLCIFAASKIIGIIIPLVASKPYNRKLEEALEIE